MALHRHGHVEMLESKLDKIYPGISDEGFVKRRKLLADTLWGIFFCLLMSGAIKK